MRLDATKKELKAKKVQCQKIADRYFKAMYLYKEKIPLRSIYIINYSFNGEYIDELHFEAEGKDEWGNTVYQTFTVSFLDDRVESECPGYF